MAIKTNEISALIKEQIKHYSQKTESSDIGTVITVGDGIAMVYGLDNAMLGELLLFPHDIYGMVMNLNEDSVGTVLLGEYTLIKEGDIVKRTGKVVEVPVGDGLLGRTVNALGQPIDGLGPIKYDHTRVIERIAPGVMQRKSVDTPIETGIKAIDAMIPIGRGQRELIIGDRQTGKTALAVDTIINQKGKNCLCVYVAIGQKTSTVVRVVERLKEFGAMAYTTVVSATAAELDPLKYIAPYSGVTMAEEWMDKGKDVLIVYDDLSKHAVAYRTLSLLLKRAPGREAYPGDVFYLHSRLLERACRLAPEYGGGSITALPIIETQAGDISAYIPTNVISITDGQIFLVTDLFNAGQRPAIDSGLSVSRVGSSAQYKCMKQVSKSLKIELANFHELQAFSQFGSDLDTETKKTLAHGEALMEVLKQGQYQPMRFERQVIELFAAQKRYLDDLNEEDIHPFLDKLWLNISKTHSELVDELTEKKEMSDDYMKRLDKVIKDLKESLKA
ncbi:MAG: F0F1 ATP synthase subunit alpha [Bacilli bacterium]|jgi:F-type H+-transporting ATPase subunit alpha|nr:F0F1 ATP synthase subunit alpha [Bacilli bacterium]